MEGSGIYIKVFKGHISLFTEMQDGLKQYENAHIIIGFYHLFKLHKRWNNVGFTLFRVFANKYNLCITICNLYLQIKLKSTDHL